jgi:hypothetical protein
MRNVNGEAQDEAPSLRAVCVVRGNVDELVGARCERFVVGLVGK